MPRRSLTPVDITARYPSFRARRVENWSAVSRDGTWTYERLEVAGTPWAVIHVPTGIEGDWYGTLTAAREATCNGTALACVERIQAHDRGEHQTERRPELQEVLTVEACGFCGEQSIGWCVVCGAPLCDGCGVPVRDFDRLCPACARPPAGEAVRGGTPVAVSIGGMPTRYMAQEDIGRQLGKGRTTVNVWRARYKDSPDPFPEPDGETGLGEHPLPGWLPERMDDIRAWLARHPRLGSSREEADSAKAIERAQQRDAEYQRAKDRQHGGDEVPGSAGTKPEEDKR